MVPAFGDPGFEPDTVASVQSFLPSLYLQEDLAGLQPNAQVVMSVSKLR